MPPTQLVDHQLRWWDCTGVLRYVLSTVVECSHLMGVRFRRGEVREDAASDCTRLFGCKHFILRLHGSAWHLGFDERIRGSHHIFTKEGVADILNLQPRRAKAKPYQVKQVRQIIVRYKMAGESYEQ